MQCYVLPVILALLVAAYTVAADGTHRPLAGIQKGTGWWAVVAVPALAAGRLTYAVGARALRQRRPVFVDMPDADLVQLQLLAVFAEYERRMIGQRTREALARVKASGVQLGSPDPMRGLERAWAATRGAAAPTRARVRPTATRLRAEGRSLRAIAAELNAL